MRAECRGGEPVVRVAPLKAIGDTDPPGMDPDRWRQIAELYDAAMERDAGERATFLRAACAGDSELAREVQSLLDQSTSAGFLGEPAMAAAARLIKDQPDALLIGRRLGVYEVQALLGVGGMGEVYRARDTTLGRDVAIKVLPSIVAADHERLVRFEREARLLAALNHSHIGAIYGVEESDGVRVALCVLCL
jgi:serine/threonine protein kinase